MHCLVPDDSVGDENSSTPVASRLILVHVNDFLSTCDSRIIRTT